MILLRKKTISIVLLTIFYPYVLKSDYDVTLTGRIIFSDGLCRIPVCLIDMLKSDLSINFTPMRSGINFQDVPMSVTDVLTKHNNREFGNVIFLCDGLGAENNYPFNAVPANKIKIAYSMFETTKFPYSWVQKLNNNFDAVVVPDEFLIDIYKQSGVLIPIFVIPCPLYLRDFLNQPLKNKKTFDKPFIFGITGGFGPGKNHEMVIDAFALEFKNSPDVLLRVHGRWGYLFNMLKEKIRRLGLTNVEILEKVLTQSELIQFMSSLDCYILLSKGEGFSITPREVMALGIPCILSNHTAHKTICKTELVRPVPADIAVPADYSFAGLFDCGNQWNCKVEDAQKALRDVYENYTFYISKAAQRRKWASQYCYTNLKNKYLTLIKPKRVVFGDRNDVTDGCLITNSLLLYHKYVNLFTTNREIEFNDL